MLHPFHCSVGLQIYRMDDCYWWVMSVDDYRHRISYHPLVVEVSMGINQIVYDLFYASYSDLYF